MFHTPSGTHCGYVFHTRSGTHCGYVFHTRSGTHCGYVFNMFVSRTKCYDENVKNVCFCRLCIQLAFEWEFTFLLWSHHLFSYIYIYII